MTSVKVRKRQQKKPRNKQRDVRLVVCIDFEDVDSLEKAYGKLVEGMNASAFAECWESSDEYFDSEQDEEPGDESLLSAARLAYWNKKGK